MPEDIENLYKKTTHLEHVLLRPDSYVGSIKKEEKNMWVYDTEKNEMVEKKITYNPALYKIFDEIIVNASDNKIRDSKMTMIRIDIDSKNNMIRIWNNGKGIPVTIHKEHGVYIPTMIFGQLMTSTNFNDDKKQLTGGRNGFGAKLCNIFSSEFVLETSSKEYDKSFKQTWANNMMECSDPQISKAAKEDYTCVTFYPDLKRFSMTHLDDDIVGLFTRRAYDIAACTLGITIFLNSKQINVKTFKDYVELYTKSCLDANGEPLKVVYESYGQRWEVAVTTSVNETFSQVSFVNSIATTKGGTHVNYLANQLAVKILEKAKKKINNDKQAVKLKITQVKNNMWIFVRCLVENPSFDSQTKENMTLNQKDFGSECILNEKFISQVAKCGIIEKLTMWTLFKNQALLDKKCSKTKQTKLKDIPKLDDANFVASKNSLQCTLILTEGDSAKSLAVSGVGVIGRDYYGIFPLKGKLLNVREASAKQLAENAEITNIIKILGLQYSQKYETPESLKTLRYGKIMIMADQDQDGSHIKGLLINFIHSKWPNLLKHNFIEQFITPIVKAFKNNQILSFYSIPELLEWQNTTLDANKWKLKYYKGLGTSTSKEAKEYFSDMTRHLIKFKYSGEKCGRSIVLAFSKTKADERKEWLTNWMEDCKRCRELGKGEVYLYGKDTKCITFEQFINQELILFSNTDNERSIPCLMDGFKPGQRKVLFACLKRNLVKELKVAQLAGSVAELSAYHHGEASLTSTIIILAQDFIGSNNINLLMPNGQFGTRLAGGKDSASPRYICTQLNKMTKLIFHHDDDAILKYLLDDNQPIEPEWYAPIIPMVLINGCDGIGTGWSSKIPNFNPRDVINNLKRMINDETPMKMHPWYRNFTGTIVEVCENKYVVNGEINQLDGTTLEITELPVRVWTNSYKENVMEIYRHGNDKTPALITDYKEYNTDTTVRFVVEMNPTKYAEADAMGFHKFFKLQTPLTLSNMILFDECGVIRKYNNETEILKNFFKVRLEMYIKRRNYLLDLLSAQASKLENQARFILDKISGKISCEDVKMTVLIEKLVAENYDSDPVKAWQKSNSKELTIEKAGDEEDQEVIKDSGKPDFDYIIDMKISNLTVERKDDLLKERDKKMSELDKLKEKSPQQMWLDDLKILEDEIDKFYNQDTSVPAEIVSSSVVKKPGKRGGKAIKIAAETFPSKNSFRLEPKIEEEYLKKLNLETEKRKKLIENKKQRDIIENFVTRENTGTNAEDDDNNSENDEDLTLAQRLVNTHGSDTNKKNIFMEKNTKVIPGNKKKLDDLKLNNSEIINLSDNDDDASDQAQDKVKTNKSELSSESILKNINFPQKQSKIVLTNKDKPVSKKQKIDKPKTVNSKTEKPKTQKKEAALKEKKEAVPKMAKKPAAPRKKDAPEKLDLSGESNDSKNIVRTQRSKRKFVPKNYDIFSDEEEEALTDDDSDFDFIAEKENTGTNAENDDNNSENDEDLTLAQRLVNTHGSDTFKGLIGKGIKPTKTNKKNIFMEKNTKVIPGNKKKLDDLKLNNSEIINLSDNDDDASDQAQDKVKTNKSELSSESILKNINFPQKQSKIVLMNRDKPVAKKQKIDKPKTVNSKTEKPKTQKKEAALKEKKEAAPKMAKKPAVHLKKDAPEKLDLSGDSNDSKNIVRTQRSKRKFVPKNYDIFSDEEEEALKDNDSDFDFIAEKRTATNKKARIISSDSD